MPRAIWQMGASSRGAFRFVGSGWVQTRMGSGVEVFGFGPWKDRAKCFVIYRATPSS